MGRFIFQYDIGFLGDNRGFVDGGRRDLAVLVRAVGSWCVGAAEEDNVPDTVIPLCHINVA